MKIAVIVGTRPEIIKMSPIIKKLEPIIIHTNQHYSPEMDAIFFKELKLPKPDYSLKVGSGSHAVQTGFVMTAVESILKQIKPEIVLVQGDTNTTLGASIATKKLKIKLGHIEAGLRSFDMNMSEELNRRMVDHISDLLFAPTQTSAINLYNENIPGESYMTGNTIVDVLNKFRLKPIKDEYFVLTLHRPENVDDKERLKNWLEVISKIELEMIFPVHPRTEKRIKQFNLNIKTTKPTGYKEFINYLASAQFVLTDSGGVQEEACILKTPCITLRENTERPETIDVESNILAKPHNLLRKIKTMTNRKRDWISPFGDGTATKKIIKRLR